jgi:two-component system sensor histidine kinase KdpD
MWVADRVDEALAEYREAHGIARPWETRERVLVAITGAPGGDDVIRRAARMSARSHGQLIGVFVRSADGLRSSEGESLEAQRRLLDELGGEYREIAGADVASALVQFANLENATQIVLGASRQSRWTHLVRGSVINNVIRASGAIDVHVISSVDEQGGGERRAIGRRSRRAVRLSPRRQAIAWSLALLAPPLVTLVLAQLRTSLTLPSDLLVFLLGVVVVAAVGGFVPALVCAVSSFLFANWYFTPPYYELTIEEGENLLALVIFLLVGGVVSLLVATASRRTFEAAQARAEAETLASLSGTLAAAVDPLPQLVAQVQAAFEADSVAVLAQEADSSWTVVAGAGSEPPATDPDRADLAVPLYHDHVLVLTGDALGPEDLEILRAFAGQVTIAVQQRALRADAARVEGLQEANELRTALLAAVSHDLRTPLSSIKASVSSLLQRDVDFTPGATQELLETIDDGADRLNHLIGNLLDMSRLQTGALRLVMRNVALEEVVPAALAGLSDADRVDADVPETLPRVQADAALLERTLANVVENALAWSPPASRVRVEACVVENRVQLRVVDRGPGIPRGHREQVFQPFQRLGDHTNDGGVGLGLAVARGFVDAMGGHLLVEDTPGGGTTMIIELELAGS